MLGALAEKISILINANNLETAEVLSALGIRMTATRQFNYNPGDNTQERQGSSDLLRDSKRVDQNVRQMDQPSGAGQGNAKNPTQSVPVAKPTSAASGRKYSQTKEEDPQNEKT